MIRTCFTLQALVARNEVTTLLDASPSLHLGFLVYRVVLLFRSDIYR